MKVVSRNQIDAEKWDHVVRLSAGFRHYYLSCFLDASSPNWHAIIEGDYKFIWPLPIKSFPLKRVFQPLLAQQLGPVVNEHFSIEKLKDAMALIESNFWSFNIKFNDMIKEVSFGSVSKHYNVDLQIPDDVDTLRKGYNRNVISNLKKSEKSGLKILRCDNESKFVVDTFRASPRSEIKELNNAFYNDVHSIYSAFLRKGEGECYVAELNGRRVAGLMLLKTHNRLLNFFTSISFEARSCGAMHALVDHVLAQNTGKNMVMDFEGSDDGNLRFFYQSFGGSERVYLQSQYTKLPSPLKNMIK